MHQGRFEVVNQVCVELPSPSVDRVTLAAGIVAPVAGLLMRANADSLGRATSLFRKKCHRINLECQSHRARRACHCFLLKYAVIVAIGITGI